MKTLDELTKEDHLCWYDKDLKKTLGMQMTEEFYVKMVLKGSGLLSKENVIGECKYNLMYVTPEKVTVEYPDNSWQNEIMYKIIGDEK